MKHFLFLLSFITCSIAIHAQSYWQQKVDTKIDVTLDDKKHMLRGYEEFSYTNNSPDTLHYLYIHLWPNGYKNDHTPFAEQQYRNHKTAFYYSSAEDKGYIDSLQFTIDGNDVDFFSGENTPDIARIDLQHPLTPGATIKIATPFKVKIPKVFSRMGHNGQAYFISQWFPKPAVYDRKGWHPIPYLDQGEFYSEIGSYDVSITLPRNYIVMATGNLQDASENNWLDSLSKAPIWKDTAKKTIIQTNAYGQKKKVIIDKSYESATTLKTLHYHEDNIHDFAWFADKRWVVRKDTVASPVTGNIVTTYSAFLPKYEKQWSKANEHLKNAVRYYGKWVGPYPYKTIKAVQGDLKAGGGMEYPTVTIIDINAGDQTTIIHEAGHNWFYGMLATNERDHAWMDEGINTFYETKTGVALKEKDSLKNNKNLHSKGANIDIDMNTVIYQFQASGEDQTIEQTSNNFHEINYGIDVYYKTSTMLKWLENYMGEDDFEAGMHDYYNTWHYKHPYPEDFIACMQRHTPKNIDWFWKEGLQEKSIIDFSIKKVTTKNDGLSVTVKNKTNMTLPVAIKAYHNDSLLATGTALPFEGTTDIELPATATNWTKIRIDPDVPDGRTPNNEYRRSGLFKRGGIKPKLFFGTNITNKQKLFLMPSIGYNFYDGFMAGILIHNLTWPETKFKYIITPIYGFSSKNWNGAASLSYTWHPGSFKEISLQADFKSFDDNKLKQGFNGDSSVFIPNKMYARYLKIAPSLNIVFKPVTELSTVTRKLTLKFYAINEDGYNFSKQGTDTFYTPSIVTKENYYGLIHYSHHNNRTFNPFSYDFEGQVGKDFVKLNLTGNIKINYHAKGKSLYVRAFAGKYFNLNNDVNADRYYLNSTSTGLSDYLYDDTYIGRNESEGFSARQISINEGGMKIPTFRYLSAYGIGRSDNWMASLNLKTDLPLKKLPIRLFFDVTTFANAGELNPSGNKVLYDGGVEIYLYDMINVYIPLVRSQDYNDYRNSITGKKSLLDGITFSVQLDKINWLKAPSEIFSLFGY